MALHYSRMTLQVPPGNKTTADMIDFRVRPQLNQMGVQTWGLTNHLSPATYTFRIEIEAIQWQTVSDTLAAAHHMLNARYGLEVL